MNTYTLVQWCVSNKDCSANTYHTYVYANIEKLVYTNVFDYTQGEKQLNNFKNKWFR